MTEKKPYYITTAIAYTSGKPHIGNVYEIVLADSIARYKRMTGYDVRFQTGTDEHGQKVEERAKAQGKTPKQFVDEVSEVIRGQFDCMGAPVVMRDDIEAEFRSEDFKGALLGADSDVFPLDTETFVKVRRSPDRQVHMLRGRNISYFSRLKSLF